MLTIFIYGYVTAIEFQICCSTPSFIKIGLRVRPPNPHYC